MYSHNYIPLLQAHYGISYLRNNLRAISSIVTYYRVDGKTSRNLMIIDLFTIRVMITETKMQEVNIVREKHPEFSLY